MQSTENGFYIHGNTPEEQQRLSLLNDLLNPAWLVAIQLKEGEKVLDVGSGLGQFTRLMAGQVQRPIIGVERDPKQLAQAIPLAEEVNQSDWVEFRQGDALDLPLAEEEWGTFDVVHSRFVLEHIPQPQRAVAQMIRALRPGGRLLLADDDYATFRTTPAPAGFHELWEAFIRSHDRKGLDPYQGRNLIGLMHHQGLSQFRNGSVFFGSCQGQDTFPIVAENLIQILREAKAVMLEEQLLTEPTFNFGIDALNHWKTLPDAALWYDMYWAEGIRVSE